AYPIPRRERGARCAATPIPRELAPPPPAPLFPTWPFFFSGGGDAGAPSRVRADSPDLGGREASPSPGPGGERRREDQKRALPGLAWACQSRPPSHSDRADLGGFRDVAGVLQPSPGKEGAGSLRDLLVRSWVSAESLGGWCETPHLFTDTPGSTPCSRFCNSGPDRPLLPSRTFQSSHDNGSWGVPLAITVAAVALKKIGYDASDVSVGWCWIDLEAEDYILWMLLTGKLWEMLAYVTLPVLYLLIRKHINRAHEALSEYRPIVSEAHQLQRHTSVADKKLVLIPLIFIFLRVWSTVRFVLTLCGSPAVRTPVLVVLHGIGNTFQGGANCIMFVLCTRAVRTRLFSLCCFCCSPQPSATSPAGPPKAPASSKPGQPQGPTRTPDELPST
uniref:G protein-coupled receptor 157 n=1 Tax=Equus caballus TaxID=9796 RepID=A0A9L0SBE5_HORSE